MSGKKPVRKIKYGLYQSAPLANIYYLVFGWADGHRAFQVDFDDGQIIEMTVEEDLLGRRITGGEIKAVIHDFIEAAVKRETERINGIFKVFLYELPKSQRRGRKTK